MNAIFTRSIKFLSGFTLFILAIFCLILVFVPTVVHRQTHLTDNIAKLIHQPITISYVTVGWFHFDPVILLKNVVLYDPKTQQPSLSIDEITIGFDLWRAFFKHEIALGSVHIAGLKMIADEIQKDIFVLQGVTRAPAFDLKNFATSQTDDFIQIEKLGYININHLDLSVNLLNGQKLKLNHIHLISENYRGYHHFQVRFSLLSNKTFDFYMMGNVLGTVYVTKSLKSNFILKTDDFKIKGQLNLEKKPKNHTHIFLLMHLPKLELVKIKDYLPAKGIKKHLKNWILNAPKSGYLFNTELLLNGNLDDFPFDQQNGIFFIKSKFTDLNLFYHKNWPLAQNLSGTLELYDRLLIADVKSGFIKHTKIDEARVILPDIGKSKPQRLILHALFSGQLANGMDFLQTGPLFQKVGKRLLNLRLFGPMQLRLHVNIPLTDDVLDHTIRAAGTISLHDAKVISTDWDVSIEHINGDLQFTQDDLFADSLKGSFLNEPISMHIYTLKNFTNVDFIGKLNFNNFAKINSNVLLNAFNGTSDFTAHLSLAQKIEALNHLIISTDLKGVAINLPKPLFKSKNEKKNLHADMVFVKQKNMVINIDYNKNVSAKAMFDLTKKINKFKEGFIIFKDPLINGLVKFTPSNIVGNFKKLHWFTAKNIQKPDHMPEIFSNIKITVDQFYLNNHLLGNMFILANPKAKTMIIDKFELENSNMNISAFGRWNEQTTQVNGNINIKNLKSFFSSLGLNYRIEASTLNTGFHFVWPRDPLHIATSNLNGHFQFSAGHGLIPFFNAKQNEQLDLGKILTLLSVESIPRRLTFNFNDIFSHGYSFDAIRGNLFIHNGMITTNDFFVHGIIADILAEGQYDLNKKIIHLKLMVEPKLLASLPAILAIAEGPVVGLATLGITWAAQPILKHVFAKCFIVHGPFAKPVVEKCSQSGGLRALPP